MICICVMPEGSAPRGNVTLDDLKKVFASFKAVSAFDEPSDGTPHKWRREKPIPPAQEPFEEGDQNV